MQGNGLDHALRQNRSHYMALAIISAAVNLTLLAGPLYMMQVYDRVLGTGAVETLVALSVITGIVIAAGAVFDILRHLLLHRLTARLQQTVEPRIFSAALHDNTPHALEDLDSVLRHRSGAAFLALYDLPFAALFLGILWAFHPMLGMIAVGTAGLLVALALAGRQLSDRPQAIASQALQQAAGFARQMGGESETLRGLGMAGAVSRRWLSLRATGLAASVATQDRVALINGTMRGLRLAVQSALLGVGAFLVIKGEMGGSAIFVSSILLGRALAPIEVLSAQWPQIRRAGIGQRRLSRLPTATAPRHPLVKVTGQLTLHDIGLDSQTGRPALSQIGFTLKPAEMLQVMGPSGAGKSALARIITRAVIPSHGTIRLDGAPYHQHPPETLDAAIGYLPQRVVFFDGTVAENISRFDPSPRDGAIITACQIAGVHEMILSLPQGYDTLLGPTGGSMSAGQLQRLALARAIYGGPKVLVLDEPDAHLDEAGGAALRHAISGLKQSGTTIVICSHDFGLTALADRILCLHEGRMALYGPRERVLAQLVAATRPQPHEGAA